MLALLISVGVGASASAAQAGTYPVGSPVWNAAIAASEAHWGSMPCGGAVTYSWTDLPEGIVGYASWMQDSSAPQDASRFSDCRLDLAVSADLGPALFCTVMAHEIGHLHGHEHVDDPSNLMAPRLGKPLPGCKAAMAPLRPAVVAQEESTPKTAAPARTAAARRNKRAARQAKARAHRLQRSRSQARRAQARRAPRR